MITTDTQAVDLMALLYAGPSGDWDYIDEGLDDDEIYFGIKDNAIICRGSVTFNDWFRDAQAAIPFEHIQLGQIPSGFWKGVLDAAKRLSGYLCSDTVIAGHSLGAAHAVLLGALAVVNGHPPAKIVACGLPHPGTDRLATILKSVPLSIYRNRFDPVPQLPLPLIGIPWQDPGSVIRLNIPPKVNDLDILADHNIALYQEGVRARETQIL